MFGDETANSWMVIMTTDNVRRLADLLIECSDLYGSIDKAAYWLDAQGVTAERDTLCAQFRGRIAELQDRCIDLERWKTDALKFQDQLDRVTAERDEWQRKHTTVAEAYTVFVARRFWW